jgi:hypothetical protein
LTRLETRRECSHRCTQSSVGCIFEALHDCGRELCDCESRLLAEPRYASDEEGGVLRTWWKEGKMPLVVKTWATSFFQPFNFR